MESIFKQTALKPIMAHRFLENITHADVAFEATGKTLSTLFKSAAKAVIETMANPKTIKPAKTFEFTKKENNVERLLFEFLEEIVYLKDKEAVVFHDVSVKVNEKTLELEAKLTGDTVNPEKQELHQDIKAVTMHNYKVEQKNGWKTTIVLDI